MLGYRIGLTEPTGARLISGYAVGSGLLFGYRQLLSDIGAASVVHLVRGFTSKRRMRYMGIVLRHVKGHEALNGRGALMIVVSTCQNLSGRSARTLCLGAAG